MVKRKWKHEEECRRIFEKYYGKNFPSVRPDLLKSPETNRNLEFDGYNEELRIGFEYNSSYHYIFPHAFHKTKKDFIRQLRNDDYKRKQCIRKGIRLVIIPYTVAFCDLQEYICKYLDKIKI